MPFRPAIYVRHNNFQIFLTAMILSICNEIQCRDKVLTKIYKNQISGLSLFAILHQLICLLPSKFIHEPFCVEKVLTSDYYTLHCRKSDLLLLNLTLSISNLVTNQTGKIGSILLKCTQNLVSSQIHIVVLKRNSLKTTEPYKTRLKVDGIFVHKELQCIF